MRTWKQGITGILLMSNGDFVFTKCLKYPLLKIYSRCNEEMGFPENLIYTGFVNLDVIKLIEKSGYIKLNREEIKLGSLFNLKYLEGSSVVDQIYISKSESIETIKNDEIMTPDKLHEMLNNLIRNGI
ncbi:MAG: hypothetical protein M0P01_06820 [Treponema sp.]|nr:hypothetical protein [Treponema sp.]